MSGTNDKTRKGGYSRIAYGPLADLAEAGLEAISDGGYGRPIDADLRWVVLTAVREALREQEAMYKSTCARCGAPIPYDSRDPRNHAMRVCDPCAVDLDPTTPTTSPEQDESTEAQA